MAKSKTNPEQDLVEAMARFYADPLGFVIYMYPWDTDRSIQLVRLQEPWRSRFNVEYGPDRWACELLDEIGAAVRERGFDGTAPVPPLKVAVASGHGIGKSTLTAWIIHWIMSTRPYAKGTVTAVTLPQLSSKTWPELVKWVRKSLNAHWWNISTGRASMALTHVSAPEQWYCHGQTCREENSEAFAGQHAANSTSFYVFDEASGIPDKIYEVALGGLTDGEPMMFCFGNPTVNTGFFADIFRRYKGQWITRNIDSRTVAITNKEYLKQLVDEYGEDSDIVKVRVRGEFPSQSARQLIPIEYVEAAMGRHVKPEQYQFAPVIIGVDPAWEGDDELTIVMRQGLVARVLYTAEKNDNDLEIATILARFEDEYRAKAVFIDAGYGTGIVSAGRSMGRAWNLVWFSGKSPDPGCWNMRSYMWKEMRDWLRDGGSIPMDRRLYEELIGPEVVPRVDGRIQLEAKHDMKRRGLASPNRADALALTFAAPVLPDGVGSSVKARVKNEYNPLRLLRK